MYGTLCALILLQAPAPAVAPVAPASEASVPGGLQALSFIARGKVKSSPDRFFADYARTLVHHSGTANPQVSQQYLNRIVGYFGRLSNLESYGQRATDRLTITLRVGDPEAQRRTARIANFLGWKTFSAGNQLQLEVAEKTQQSRRKETASALEIDEIAMQEALQAGRPFTFQIPYERVTVRPDEKTWRLLFYADQNLTGGLAEAMARDVRLAKLYAGLHDLSAETRSALLAAADLKRLADSYADQVFYHASAFGVAGGRVLVPGGEPAEAIWATLAGADPRHPPAFLRALLEKDQGALLAFYAIVAGANPDHQRFATRDGSRTQTLYDLFRAAPDHQNAGKMTRESAFVDFLREAPLDAEGRLRFPGGPAAWRPEGAKAAADDMAIIQRLARAEFNAARTRRPELAAFLAVARIEKLRNRPLDEVSARLLARHFYRYAAFYPYFEVLSGLGEREFEPFFAWGEKMHERSGPALNHIVGQFQSLVALICLAQQAGALTEAQAAEAFRALCTRLVRANSPADVTSASLDMARAILGTGSATSGLDEKARHILLGQGPPVKIAINGAERELDPSAIRHGNYKRVMELQKVPSLDALVTIYDAARNLANGAGEAREHLRLLGEAAGSLPAVEVPNAVRGRKKQNLDQQAPESILRQIEALRRAAADNRAEWSERSRDLLEAVSPQVKLALSGILYAYYLHPDDLLVSEDPLLLRKHEFVEFGVMRILPHVFLWSGLQTGVPGGSYLQGGFADFATTAGQVALAGAKQSDSPSEAVFDAQVGRLRATQWSRLRDEDVKGAANRIRAARAWIAEAAAKPDAQADLMTATVGVLSPARRAQLFEALRSRNPASAGAVVTLADLYWLGARGSKDHPGWLESAPAAPYEDYERCLLPQRLAGRVAEFSLYLNEYADRRAWPAAALAAIAEPLAQEILRELPMSDLRDWRSVLEAFATIDDTMVERVLGKQ